MVDKPAFKMGDYVEKISGSSWRGRVVGTYSTDLTREGYAVESDTEKGSVQIYPAKALRLATPTEDARGRVKVPRIATTEMVEAGAQFAHIMDLWTAMVEAAPSTPVDDCAELLREARWYVNDSLEAHEHSDGRDLLNRIDTALGNKETDRHG